MNFNLDLESPAVAVATQRAPAFYTVVYQSKQPPVTIQSPEDLLLICKADVFAWPAELHDTFRPRAPLSEFHWKRGLNVYLIVFVMDDNFIKSF